MDAFTMEIAGLVICVHPMFQSTKEYCRPYLSNKTHTFEVFVAAEDLVHEQMLLDLEAVEEGLKLRKFKEPFLERSVIQRRVADRLLHENVLMMHGSTVAVDGQAYLFTAACGMGKSTHTRLWREAFGDRAIMVNDDKPFLKITSEGVLAYGSPWGGKHGLATNVCVPLKGICLLHRGKDNVIQRVMRERLMETLLHQAHSPEDINMHKKVVSLVDALAEKIPLWEMYCNKDADAPMVSYAAMSRISF